MGYPENNVFERVGYGMGYAKWDMQKEVSEAGQSSFCAASESCGVWMETAASAADAPRSALVAQNV